MKKICVLGLGYIGLPTAAMFANHGFLVRGIDINDQILAVLRNGEIHIQEPGLHEMVSKALSSGSLQVSSQPEPADAFIIAVPTPFYPDKTADMRAVTSATEAVLPHLRPGSLVVLESTSPPLTTLNLVRPILERCRLKAGTDFYLAYSPERVLPGRILQELVENARVIGGVNRTSAEAGRDLYAAFVKGEIVLTDSTTAEMVKLMENSYRDMNVAIANEYARLADRFGIDVWEAIQIANRHPRVKILNPGAGVGGHCISVDPWFLVEAAPDLTTLIRAARQVNDDQPRFVTDLVRRALGGGPSLHSLNRRRIAVLGLSYKEDVDDLRESPAVEAANLLAKAGARVTAYEPYQQDTRFASFETASSLEEVLVGAEVLVLLVGHSTFRNLKPAQVAALTPARLIVDAVNGWTDPDWLAAGFQVFRLGVGRRDNR